ncbi:MAG: DNA polymerase III subunit beta [Thermodesulfobacteriota bacterium]|nr:DNA polymerase III subunit beta [Thermodesulfobacteriota bacterium]
MPEGSVNIKVIENSQVEISKDKIRFKMKGLPEEEYPKTVEYEDAYFIQIKMNDFIDLVNRTVFIIPQDRSSNSVNGAKIEFLDEDGKYKIRMVSTDGYRLACVDRNVEISACPPESAIIPRKALLEIKRLSEDAEEEEIKIGFSNGNCIVMLNDFIMNMRILSGEFPQYKEIIPQNFRYEFIILRSALLSALRRISLITERTGFVTYIFSENSLRLFGSDPHLGEVSEEITLDYYGEDITTAFNARLMLDILGNIECEEICFKFVDSNTPAMILPKEYEGFFYLIMPISVEDILEDKIESAFSDEQSECVEEGDR